MRAMTRVVCALLLLAAAIVPGTAFAVGEQNGRIKGLITEATSGAPLGGADITVSGPALIGGPRALQSNDDGTYEIPELPPGVYDVEVSFGGTNPARRRVKVRQDETAPLNIAWSIELKEVQTYHVVEELHLTRPDSTATGTVLGADTEARLATQRNYPDVLNQVAGVTTTPGKAIPNIKGGNRLHNRYLVDGMDITDSVTNNFSQQVNFDAINSIEVLTGGMEAQYNSLGGVINLNTAAGSDKLHIDSSFYFNSDKLAVGSQTGPFLWEQERPFSIDPSLTTQTYQANFNVSGPILLHKLWYNVSFEYDYKQSQIPIAPPLNVQHPARREHDFFPRIKLTWAPNIKHRVTLSANGDPAFVYNRDQTNRTLPVSEYGQSQGGSFAVLQWDYFHSQKLSTNLQTGFNYDTVSQFPMGEFGGIDPLDPNKAFSAKNYTYDPNAPRHINNLDGTNWYNGQNVNLDKRYTAQFDPSVSLRGKLFGEHDAKMGIQNRFVYHHFFQNTPGGAFYTDNPAPGSVGDSGLCDPMTKANCVGSSKTTSPSFKNSQWGYGIGAYVQDRWRATKRLMILPGIRIDYGLTKNSIGETVSSMFAVGPRLGATFDVTGDQKTIVSAYYGRATDTLYLLAASRADVTALKYKADFDPKTNDFTANRTVLSGLPGSYKLDPNATPPHTDEIEARLSREFFHNSVAGINYTYKKISNIWDAVEVNQIWDPSGVRVIGYANTMPQQVYKYTTPDGNYRIYQGIDFTVESRPTPNWDFYAAYTLSWLYGPGAEEISTVGTASAFYNPRQYKFFDGFLPEDQRHQFKVHGSYAWHGLTLGANFAYLSGSPLTKVYYNRSDNTYENRRTPQGTDPGSAVNDPHTTAAFRLPDIIQLDVRVSYDAYELLHQHVIVIADLFNIFNTLTPTAIETRDIALYGAANSFRTQPFHVQLGLRYSY
jgi:hypothetical protein